MGNKKRHFVAAIVSVSAVLVAVAVFLFIFLNNDAAPMNGEDTRAAFVEDSEREDTHAVFVEDSEREDVPHDNTPPITPAASTELPVTYIVQWGDNIDRIARMFYGNSAGHEVREHIRVTNDLENYNQLYVGQVLELTPLTPAPTLTPSDNVIEWETMQFGGRNWLVLDVRGNHALLLHETVITNHSYHSTDEAVTWETSASRAWLNGEFYESFSEADRARIMETTVINNDNPWTFYERTGHWNHTNGGADTTDKIFLLSIEEFVRYFGGGDLLELGRNESNRDGSIDGLYYWSIWENNAVSQARIAYDEHGLHADWWLRSAGGEPYLAARISLDDRLSIYGGSVGPSDLWEGLRPALWLNLE